MKENPTRMKICMIVPEMKVCGGIAAVTAGYRGSRLEEDCRITYVESYRDGSKFKKLTKALGAYARYLRVLRSDNFDLVHIHSSFGPSFYRKLFFINVAYRKKIPIVNHIHGAEFDAFWENASERKKKLIRKTYDKCSCLIALSEEWKGRLSQIVSEDKVCVIPNYSILHPEAFDGRNYEKERMNVLFLGELGHRKGVYDIVEIASLVHKSRGEKIHFTLAGSGCADDEAAIKKRVKELGLDGIIDFPGWIRGEDKSRALTEADMFLLPSYNEGMPMSILDACGYGLPIVASDVGGIPKIVQNGINGYTLHPGDIEAFAQAIIRLADSEALMEKMGKASYELVEKDYSLEKHIEKIEKVWGEISSNRGK